MNTEYHRLRSRRTSLFLWTKTPDSVTIGWLFGFFSEKLSVLPDKKQSTRNSFPLILHSELDKYDTIILCYGLSGSTVYSCLIYLRRHINYNLNWKLKQKFLTHGFLIDDGPTYIKGPISKSCCGRASLTRRHSYQAASYENITCTSSGIFLKLVFF